ncbi:unnamed protein product [Aspergillus oryzae]|uniref:Unnamed protein product n=1 Tax=Aspergillus oryzae var. brunneus TaxID=332754 RepID=A0ABQ6KQI7_ASPOZ|nr:unnamed protein product [Aspergillus oryzae]GMF85021.1 unnamed protein product [Aspergillus oryzae]GMG45781.1 unnamed protein product [Aspergillus oryzae var. brunneus]
MLRNSTGSQDMEILDWLSPTDQAGGEQSAIYSKAQRDRTSQTGDWFLNSRKYRKWKAEPGSIMWLHGVGWFSIPNAHKVCEFDTTKRLAYWYFNFNQNGQQAVDIMLRSVIRQLCPNPLPESIMKSWEAHRQGREPTQAKLFDIFEQMIESYTGHIVLILDALDECPRNAGELCTSRFRWADLQIMRLERCHTEVAINNVLETLPKDLSETYSAVLNDVPEDDRDAARTILIWVTFSRHPLTLEFLANLAGLIRPEDVVDICTTYLINVSSDNFIRLAHFSVKEFLVSADVSGETDWYRFSASTGHLTIANTSLSLLLKTDDNLTRDAALGRPSIAHLFSSSVAYLNWVRIANDYRASNSWYLSVDELEPPIYRASKMGLLRIVQNLLEKGADPLAPFYEVFPFEENAFYAAAEMGHLDVLELLLEMSTVISKDLACTIINRIDYGDQERERVSKILTSLHDKTSFYNDPKHGNAIDERIIAAVAGNRWSGDILIQILLDWPNRAAIHITRDVMGAAVHNIPCGEIIMGRLLEEQGIRAYIDPCGVTCMIEYGYLNPGVVKIVVETRGREIQFDDWTMERFMEHASPELTELLLACRDDISVTSKMLEAAADNENGPGALRVLMKKRASATTVSTEVLATAAANTRCGLEIMKVLLEEWSPNTPIGEEVIYELASNSKYGPEIMNLFLQREQTGIAISQEVLAEAARFNRREMLEILVNNAGSGITITTEILCEAALNWWSAEAVMTYLLELGGKDLEISEDVLVSAARNADEGANLLTSVLDRFPEARVTDRVFKAACHSRNSMSVLLERFPNPLPKEIVVEGIAEDVVFGHYALEVLLGQEIIDIDQDLVEKLAHSPSALETLLKFKPDFPVSHQTLLVAATNAGCMNAVLSACKMEIAITADIVDAALMSVDFQVIHLLFGQYKSRFPITDMVLTRTALSECPDDPLHFLLEKEPGVDLQLVWENVWQSDSLEADKLGASNILVRHAGLKVTESMMENTAFRSVGDEHDFDHLIQFCGMKKIPMPGSERAMWIVIERFHDWWTVECFLKHNPEIKLTQEQFDALAGDASVHESMMETLLDRKDF